MNKALFLRLPRWSDQEAIRTLSALAAAVVGSIAIALLHIETSLAIALFLAGIYAGSRRPDIGLALIALSVPVQRSLLVGVGDTAVTTTKVLLWSTIAGWIWSMVAGRRTLLLDKVTIGAALTAGGVALSGWNARDGGLWMGETYRWVTMVPVACMAFNVFRRGWSPVSFLVASAGGAIASCTLALWQVSQEIGPDSFVTRGFMRAVGSFGHPNQLAVYFESLTPVLLAIVIWLTKDTAASPLGRQMGRFKALWVIATLAGLGGLLLTQSRGGGVGMVAGLATVLVLTWPIIRIRSHALMAVAGATMIISSIGLFIVISEGLLTTDERGVHVTPGNFAVEERIAHWNAGVEMAIEHPFLGVGAGNFDMSFRDATTTWRFRIGRGHAHNSYIQMLAQSGVVGFAGYAVLIATVGLTVAQALDRSRTGLSRALTVGVAGMSAALLVHAVFEYVHVLSLNLQMAISWGLVSAIAAGGLDAPDQNGG
ncbi:MAG: O-antigen ligase family protein [Thermomicrobiales bacterium]